MTPGFWRGFFKKADAVTGGQGHTGAGKGSISGQLTFDQHNSTQEGYGRADGADTRTDKTLLDRERTARDFAPGQSGPEFQDESNPHIRY
jgi:hypothetical protein